MDGAAPVAKDTPESPPEDPPAQSETSDAPKRSSADEGERSTPTKSKKTSTFHKSPVKVEQGSFYRKVFVLRVAPSALGLIDLVDRHARAWEYQLGKLKLTVDQARSVLLHQLIECIDGHVTAVLRKEFPDMRYFTEAQAVELPPLLASIVGRLTYYRRENCPDLVLDVPVFLTHIRRAITQRNWLIAEWFAVASIVPLLKAMSSRNSQWILPLKADSKKSLLSGGYTTIDGNTHAVSTEGGSRRHDLMHCALKLREYRDKNDYFVPRVLPSEVRAVAILTSYTYSTRRFSWDEFDRELFMPIMDGQNLLSS